MLLHFPTSELFPLNSDYSMEECPLLCQCPSTNKEISQICFRELPEKVIQILHKENEENEMLKEKNKKLEER